MAEKNTNPTQLCTMSEKFKQNIFFLKSPITSLDVYSAVLAKSKHFLHCYSTPFPSSAIKNHKEYSSFLKYVHTKDVHFSMRT